MQVPERPTQPAKVVKTVPIGPQGGDAVFAVLKGASPRGVDRECQIRAAQVADRVQQKSYQSRCSDHGSRPPVLIRTNSRRPVAGLGTPVEDEPCCLRGGLHSDASFLVITV